MPSVSTALGMRKISINKNKEEIEKNIFVYFYLLIFYNRVAAYWILAKDWYSNKNE